MDTLDQNCNFGPELPKVSILVQPNQRRRLGNDVWYVHLQSARSARQSLGVQHASSARQTLHASAARAQRAMKFSTLGVRRARSARQMLHASAERAQRAVNFAPRRGGGAKSLESKTVISQGSHFPPPSLHFAM